MYQPAMNIQPQPVTREQFLRIPGQTIRQGTYTQTDSPTKSSNRVRWVTLAQWNMQNDFLTFWNSLPDGEKHEYITNTFALEYQSQLHQIMADPTSEDMLSQHLDSKYSQLHNLAAQPTPAISLPHSRIIRRDGFYQTIGNPDYIFVEQAGSIPRTLYAVLELKTFWKVTPQKIMEVMNGTAPLTGYHSGRLAMEQIYGYMVRNAKRYGILTAANWWVFLRRENGGQLYMTAPFDCQITSPPYAFTILQALYYFSALSVHNGHLVETDENGNPVTIELADSASPKAAPLATGEPDPTPTTGDAFITYPPPQTGQYYTLVSEKLGHSILIEPWKSENCLGGKSFRGTLMPNNRDTSMPNNRDTSMPNDERVIVKLWDGYKFQPDMRDREVEIYMKLQILWGKYTPSLICSADIDFCYSLIMTEVKGRKLSVDIMTDKVKSNVYEAIDAIHGLGVIHGDIRMENVLVLEDESVRFIDFENSAVLDADDSMFRADRAEVDIMFLAVRHSES